MIASLFEAKYFHLAENLTELSHSFLTSEKNVEVRLKYIISPKRKAK